MSDTRVLDSDCGACGGDVWSCKCAPADRLSPTDAVPVMTEELRAAQKRVQPMVEREAEAERITAEIMDFRMGAKGMNQQETFNWLVERSNRLAEIEASSGALRTYDPLTHVAVPREELAVVQSDLMARGTGDLWKAITRWLADGNEEGR